MNSQTWKILKSEKRVRIFPNMIDGEKMEYAEYSLLELRQMLMVLISVMGEPQGPVTLRLPDGSTRGIGASPGTDATPDRLT